MQARDDQRMAEELQVAQFQQLFAAAQQHSLSSTAENGSSIPPLDEGVSPEDNGDVTTSSSLPVTSRSTTDDLDEDYDA